MRRDVEQVLAKVNKHAYHFAFLDPFNLGNLSFEVIQKLSRRLKHVDILAHVSVLDLNRNLRRYIEEPRPSTDSRLAGARPLTSACRTTSSESQSCNTGGDC